ncbi:hypothetical protein AWB64_04605 [Caballeronia sordidicola]|uniref:Integrase catalytic domain-containing protein n=1 Tax=Caballeronia sordidicola TaxID=196367 RepID=A0A158HGZ6_CABSO|nr:hypothetical protein [Caballeronia sordidicola]SAL43397.1 hypothetical protein AWB64_04605 [Caballeronia sordidicola]
MNTTDFELDSGAVFGKFDNFVHTLPSGNEVLYRYLGETEKHVFAVKIGKAKDGQLALAEDDDKVANRVRLLKSEVVKHMRTKCMRRVSERGIPAEMAAVADAGENDSSFDRACGVNGGTDDAQPTGVDAEKWREHIPEGGPRASVDVRMRRRLVRYIDESFGDAPFTDPEVYTEMVECAATLFRVAKKTVRKYYERYLFYGGHRNATADQNWKRGGPKKPRLGLMVNGQLVAQGRKTDAEKLDPNTRFKRKQLRPKMLARWVKFIWEHAGERGMTLSRLLYRFKGKLVGHNRDSEGALRSYPIDPRNYPSDESLLIKGKVAFDAARIELARCKNEGRQRGNTSQLADGDLDVLDIDGTVADQFLRLGDYPISIAGALKPTILLAVDRGSRAIVGWYVTLGVENSNAYLACVFSAYTDKERELVRWGVQHLDGMVYGCARSIFVDRYAGMSEKMQKTIVSEMKQRILIAEPGNAKGKGDVENLIGLMQKEIGNLPGSSYREPVRGAGDQKDAARRRNRQKLQDAPKGAVLTMRQFMQALLTAISKHNLTADVRHLCTEKMTKRGIPPVPKEVYLFNKKRRRGDRAWEWEEEKVYRMLSVPFNEVAPDGIVTIKKRCYTSLRLQDRAREYEISNGGSIRIEGFEMFTSPLHLLWDTGDGFELLEATDRTENSYGDGYKFVHDFISMLTNAALKKARDKARKHPKPEEAPQNVVSKEKQRRMAKIDGLPTPDKRAAKARAAEVASAEDAAFISGMLNGNESGIAKREREPAQGVLAYSSIDTEQHIDIDW